MVSLYTYAIGVSIKFTDSFVTYEVGDSLNCKMAHLDQPQMKCHPNIGVFKGMIAQLNSKQNAREISGF